MTLVEITLFPSNLLAAGMALALQHFVDTSLINAEVEGDLMLVLTVPTVQSDLYGVVEGEAVVRMLHFGGS
ncbi:hypothetical protein [Rhizobium esperanzae]|uniref:Uncharacterized protein n=1 Tax=Rhizobium esperanzae TaxID=1967781 RepID=A0A7W6W5M9_9HYPH|nr:hypothetical protein [Rhizobium esperanzae]MBB4236668.1 hypothetical protein [Rhizobium esperanzae]